MTVVELVAALNADPSLSLHDALDFYAVPGAAGGVMRTERHYYTIGTRDGYRGTYATKDDAKHARRRMFGIRALAHPIIRVAGTPRKAR